MSDVGVLRYAGLRESATVVAMSTFHAVRPERGHKPLPKTGVRSLESLPISVPEESRLPGDSAVDRIQIVPVPSF